MTQTAAAGVSSFTAITWCGIMLFIHSLIHSHHTFLLHHLLHPHYTAPHHTTQHHINTGTKTKVGWGHTQRRRPTKKIINVSTLLPHAQNDPAGTATATATATTAFGAATAANATAGAAQCPHQPMFSTIFPHMTASTCVPTSINTRAMPPPSAKCGVYLHQ